MAFSLDSPQGMMNAVLAEIRRLPLAAVAGGGGSYGEANEKSLLLMMAKIVSDIGQPLTPDECSKSVQILQDVHRIMYTKGVSTTESIRGQMIGWTPEIPHLIAMHQEEVEENYMSQERISFDVTTGAGSHLDQMKEDMDNAIEAKENLEEQFGCRDETMDEADDMSNTVDECSVASEESESEPERDIKGNPVTTKEHAQRAILEFENKINEIKLEMNHLVNSTAKVVFSYEAGLANLVNHEGKYFSETSRWNDSTPESIAAFQQLKVTVAEHQANQSTERYKSRVAREKASTIWCGLLLWLRSRIHFQGISLGTHGPNSLDLPSWSGAFSVIFNWRDPRLETVMTAVERYKALPPSGLDSFRPWSPFDSPDCRLSSRGIALARIVQILSVVDKLDHETRLKMLFELNNNEREQVSKELISTILGTVVSDLSLSEIRLCVVFGTIKVGYQLPDKSILPQSHFSSTYDDTFLEFFHNDGN